MELKLSVGPELAADGAVVTARGGKTGELAVMQAHSQYQEAIYRGNSYYLAASGAGATAYVGAAGGTPLVAMHNPAGSNKILVLLAVSIANRVAASAAGTVSMGIWAGPSALPTGTVTNPTNLLSLMNTGSVARGFVNAVLTGSTALNLIMSPWMYYWATGAGAIAAPGFVELAGMIQVIPGNQVAIGATSALTSATWDVSLLWEEIAL